MVRARGVLRRVDVRHHGAADLQSGAQAGHPGLDGSASHRFHGRLRDRDFHGRLGLRRRALRHPGRPYRPRPHHGLDHSLLHGFHRPQHAGHRHMGLQLLPLPVRIGRGRAVCRGRLAGGGGGAGAGAAIRIGHSAIVFQPGKYDRGHRRHHARIPRTLGRHSRGVALGISVGRGTGAAGIPGIPQAERA